MVQNINLSDVDGYTVHLPPTNRRSLHACMESHIMIIHLQNVWELQKQLSFVQIIVVGLSCKNTLKFFVYHN